MAVLGVDRLDNGFDVARCEPSVHPTDTAGGGADASVPTSKSAPDKPSTAILERVEWGEPHKRRFRALHRCSSQVPLLHHREIALLILWSPQTRTIPPLATRDGLLVGLYSAVLRLRAEK